MSARSWKICAVLVCIGTLSAVFGRQYGLGFFTGAAGGILLYMRNHRFWNDIVDYGTVPKGTGVFHFAVNYGIMAGILILSAKYPRYLNIFTAAAGLMIVKITIVTEALLFGKE